MRSRSFPDSGRAAGFVFVLFMRAEFYRGGCVAADRRFVTGWALGCWLLAVGPTLPRANSQEPCEGRTDQAHGDQSLITVTSPLVASVACTNGRTRPLPLVTSRSTTIRLRSPRASRPAPTMARTTSGIETI